MILFFCSVKNIYKIAFIFLIFGASDTNCNEVVIFGNAKVNYFAE